MENIQEKREHSRYHVFWKAELQPELSNPPVVKRMVLDISVGGVCFGCQTQLKQGGKIVLTMRPPLFEPSGKTVPIQVQVLAVVAYSRYTGNEFKNGLQFIKFSSGKEVFDAFCARGGI